MPNTPEFYTALRDRARRELAEIGRRQLTSQSYNGDPTMLSVVASLPPVVAEIAAEREYQVEKWGNDFDDANTAQDWAAFIMHYTAVGITSRLGAAPGRPFREAMLKVATLAIAAIEAQDRRAAPRDSTDHD